MSIDRITIETLVGTKISNIDLYQKAFTHKSALKEDPTLTGSFETLEFIGDSVLGFVITKFLYDKYEDRQEGFLTKARTKLVRGETLAGIASKLELYKWIRMDEKGMRNQWIHNPKILEDFKNTNVPLYNFLLNKWYIDEFYEKAFVNPAKKIGSFFWKKGDIGVIDRFGPDGISKVIKFISNKAVQFQSGYIYDYAFVMLIGLSALITFLILN